MVTDPSVKVAKTGNKVCSFRIAVDDGFGDKKHTDFINVTCFGKQAETCERYLAKGRQVALEGKLHTDSYENKEGRKVYTTEVWATNVEFIGSKSDGNSAPQQTTIPQGFEETEDSLPF